MRHPAALAPFLAVLALVPPACTRARAAESGARVADSADDLFSTAVLPQLHLALPPDAEAALAAKPKKFVKATLWYGGLAWPDVGVRLKGHRGLRSLGEKPSFKISFDKFVPGRRFLGLRTLTLNSMVEDPTMLREALAYRLFRAAGVPAPRTGYAELWVNGRLYGLYLDVESVDEELLGAGELYEGEYGCDLYPDDVEGFDQDGGEDEDRAELAALAAAAAGDPARLFGGDEPLLDRERVLAFLAVSAVVGDFDGYRHSHNYRIYRAPATGRWVLIPWGLDRTFKKRLDVYDSNGVAARVCFADPACRRDYVATVQREVARLEALDLPRAARELAAFIDAAAARDPRKPYDAAKTSRARAELLAYVAARPGELRAATSCWGGSGEVDRDGDGAGCMDCDDADPAVHPGAAELCDGRDNDCSGVADDAAECPCALEIVDSAAFELCNLPMSWDEAAAFCGARGATLARLDAPKQSKRLYRAARELDEGRWWIGLSDRAEEGVFRWHDGAPLDATYFKKGQPDNDGCNEDCVALREDAKGRWHDTHCAQRRPFICRRLGPVVR